MHYLSVCSGIEAATVAWHPLGWTPVAFSEVEPFPCAVLAHHYPDVPNLGDMTNHKEWNFDSTVDLLVGGTPCQSFSVAGLRAGMADPRGNLALVFLAIADRYRPRWVLWENVPGVLSSNGGRDFGSFLGALGELGYGWSYRVLDAQYAGVPQRRRRVFVVGHLGDWRRAAAVLFERHSLSGDSPPRREAREDAAAYACQGTNVGEFGTLRSGNGHLTGGQPFVAGFTAGSFGSYREGCGSLRAQGGDLSHGSETLVAHALRAEGFDASEDGTGRGTPLVPVVRCGECGEQFSDSFGTGIGTLAPFECPRCGEEERITPMVPTTAPCLTQNYGKQPDNSDTSAGPMLVPVAFAENSRAELRLCGGDGQTSSQLTTGGGKPGQGMPCVAFKWSPGITTASAVRRLTPEECEALQGFPRSYTAVPYRGKPAADGPRYRALGNSMAVPVMRWLGERIAMVDALETEAAA